MYCISCGNKVAKTAKYCSKCGHPVNENVDNNPYINQGTTYNYNMPQNMGEGPTLEDKKKRRTALIISLVCGGVPIVLVVVFFVVAAFFMITTIKDFSAQEYVKIGDTEILNFFSKYSDVKLCGVSTSTDFSGQTNTNVDFDICSYDNMEKDVNEYFDYMIENFGFEDSDEYGYRSIIKRVEDTNYVVDISFDVNYGTLSYDYYYNKNYTPSIPVIPEYNEDEIPAVSNDEYIENSNDLEIEIPSI